MRRERVDSDRRSGRRLDVRSSQSEYQHRRIHGVGLTIVGAPKGRPPRGSRATVGSERARRDAYAAEGRGHVDRAHVPRTPDRGVGPVERVADLGADDLGRERHAYARLERDHVALQACDVRQAVVHAQPVEHAHRIGQAARKARPVARRLGRPGHLGERECARVRHVLHRGRRLEVLGPEIALRTEDPRGFSLPEHVGDRLVRVHLLEREQAADRERLESFVSLVVVEVERRRGRHDHVAPLPRRVDPPTDAAPTHHRGAGCESALEDLVPPDESAPARGEPGVDPSDEPALQLMFVLEPFARDDLLRHRARLPSDLRCLVPPDVDQPRGEEREHLGQHVLQELERPLARAEDVVGDAPDGEDLEWSRGAGELGVGGDGRERVARHLDLGDHGHVARRRVGDDLAHLVLRVEAAVRRPVADVGRKVLRDHRLLAAAADLSEARILLDLDPPALVLGEMPVERVELVERHEVDVALDERDRLEVAPDVEMQTAIREAWCVGDRHRPDARHRRVTGSCRVDQLLQCQQRIEPARCARGGDRHGGGGHGECVALESARRVAGDDPDPDIGGAELGVTRVGDVGDQRRRDRPRAIERHRARGRRDDRQVGAARCALRRERGW